MIFQRWKQNKVLIRSVFDSSKKKKKKKNYCNGRHRGVHKSITTRTSISTERGEQTRRIEMSSIDVFLLIRSSVPSHSMSPSSSRQRERKGDKVRVTWLREVWLTSKHVAARASKWSAHTLTSSFNYNSLLWSEWPLVSLCACAVVNHSRLKPKPNNCDVRIQKSKWICGTKKLIIERMNKRTTIESFETFVHF